MSTLTVAVINSITGEDNRSLAGAVSVVAIVAATAVYRTLSSKDKGHDFPKLPGIQLFHAWSFFQRRFDFLQSNFERNIGRSFSFNVLRHNVVVLTGEDARQAFFSNSHFDFAEGYKVLMGAAPQNPDVYSATDENVNLMNKKLNRILNNARLREVFPTLAQDITSKADKWGKNGRIDPFIEIYDLVFVMTARTTTCHDLVKNEAHLKKIGGLFRALQTSATPVSLLLPWFPGPARMTGIRAGIELYTLLYSYIETRRRAEPTNDAIDILIADGETTQNMVGFIMSATFAGVVNTSIVSCWMLIYLAIHPEWRDKCAIEIRRFLSHHLKDTLSATFHEKLGAIPVSAWDDQLPILDACIRETLRIIHIPVALRRNVREDIKICGQVVNRGDFLVYSLAEVHLNPEYYPEPHKWDPGRWLRPDPVPNTIYPFLGWGAGRHACTGAKAAKLEMKLIAALFLTRYEFEIVDKDGKFPDPLPVPNRNDNLARPLGATCYFNFEKVDELMPETSKASHTML